MRSTSLLFLLMWIALPHSLHAQPARGELVALATAAPDLRFPTEASSLGFLSAPRLAIYKPAGVGPFPAVVLHHHCSGLSSNSWQNMAMLEWAREAVSRGYVALVLDSLGQRGVDTLCEGPRAGVTFARGIRDAFQAAEHLRTFSFVDGQRIVFAGFSWGGIVGVALSSAAIGNALTVGNRFRAVVAVYPRCFPIRPGASEIVYPDIDRPLLLLLGGLDLEAPALECTSRLEPIRASGAPIDWHVYPDATHCWDCANLNGFRKTVRGNNVQYRYRDDITKDSADRMFGFYAKVLADSK